MPWHIESGDGGFFVVNSETGKRANDKPHPSRKAAIKHMKALYVNVPEARKETGPASHYSGAMVALYPPPEVAAELAVPGGLPPTDLHLTLAFLGDASRIDAAMRVKIQAVLAELAKEQHPILGPINGQGRFFANSENDDKECVFAIFDAPELPAFQQKIMDALYKLGAGIPAIHGFMPHMTLSYVEPGTPVEVKPVFMRFSEVHLVFAGDHHIIPLGDEAVIAKEVAAQPSGVPAHGAGGTFSSFGLGHYGMSKKKKKRRTVKEFVLRVIGRLTNTLEESIPLTLDQPVAVFKDSKGNYRWVMISSNAFRDRDDEIVSTKALLRDVQRSDDGGNYGPLRWWHMKGVDIGDADYRAMFGRMLVESGTFRNPVVAEKVRRHAKDLRVSIGFTHPANEPDAGGVFHNITVFERSLVPVGRAANDYTMLTVKGE